MALTEILSRCYVHLGAGGVAAILEIAEKMRSVGKDGLLVCPIAAASCGVVKLNHHVFTLQCFTT